MSKRILLAFGCISLVVGILVSPPCLGPLAAPDGRIDSLSRIMALWLACLVLESAGVTCFWLTRSNRPFARRLRLRLHISCRFMWSNRYQLTGGILIAGTLVAVTFGMYACAVNRVDLLARLEPTHPLGREILDFAQTSGGPAALKVLLERSRIRPPTVRLTPYQLWDSEPDASKLVRESFLAGDLGKAIGTEELCWRPNDRLPWGDSQGVNKPFQLQRQTFLFHVLRDPISQDHPRALSTASAYVDEWRRHNPVWPNFNRYAWGDDVVSNRVQAQMLLMDQRRAQGMVSADEEEKFLVSLIQHADRLADDRYYKAGTNHGMMQNSALLSIAVGYPEFDRGGVWKRIAVTRVQRYVRESVSSEGVSLELAPFYHWFGTVQLVSFVAVCQREHIPLDPFVEKAARLMLTACRELLHPDKSLPMIADTPSECRSVHNWPFGELPRWPELNALRAATADKKTMPNEPGARLWREPGYFILRAPAPRWSPESAMMLLFKAGSRSRAHSHFDALSLTLYANGRPLLSGPGYPDYEDEAVRDQIISTVNQSTVSIDSRSQELVPADIQFCDCRERPGGSPGALEFAAIRARTSPYDGVQHCRTIFYGPSRTKLLLVDELSSQEEHDYRQQFRIANGCYAAITRRSVELSAIGENRVALRINAHAVRDRLVVIPEMQLSGSVAWFGLRTKDTTFITELEVGGMEGQRASLSGQEVWWKDSLGCLSIRLPIKDGSCYRWLPIRENGDCESGLVGPMAKRS